MQVDGGGSGGSGGSGPWQHASAAGTGLRLPGRLTQLLKFRPTGTEHTGRRPHPASPAALGSLAAALLPLALLLMD